MNTPSNPGRDNLDDLIQQYNQELLRYHQRNRVRVPLTPRTEFQAEEAEETEALSSPNTADTQAETVSAPAEAPAAETEAGAPPEQAEKHVQWEAFEPASETGVRYVRPDPSLDDWSGALAEPASVHPERAEESSAPESDAGTPSAPESTAGKSLAEEEAAPFEEPPATDTGYLIIQAFTARSALPVEGAHVTVSRTLPDGNVLQEIAMTDRDGKTRSIPLPAADPELSQQPGFPHPYITYSIRIVAPGYIPVRDFNVPLYGGITAIQPVELIPEPESGTPEDIVINEGGPQDL